MNNLLHISSNVFKDLNHFHSTRKIWEELSVGFDEYHILARSETNHFSHTVYKNIHLHLIPNLWTTKSFFFTSIYMKKIIKRNKINYMLTQCSILGGPIAAYYSKKYSIPLMTEIHGMEYFRILNSKKIKHFLIKKIIRSVFNNSTKVRSLSSKMTMMLNDLGIKKNIVEIPNRVNTKIFGPPKNNNKIRSQIKIVSVGRYVWEKNYESAIDVISKIQPFYNVSLTLIGDGPLKEKYQKLIDDKKVNVKLEPWSTQEELVPLIKMSDIYIQPSISEGVPRTMIEAMALKIPIITTNVGGIEGIIVNDYNGILIEKQDNDSLESAIVKLIKDEKLREELSENAYSTVIEKYEWESVFSKYRQEIKTMEFSL